MIFFSSNAIIHSSEDFSDYHIQENFKSMVEGLENQNASWSEANLIFHTSVDSSNAI